MTDLPDLKVKSKLKELFLIAGLGGVLSVIMTWPFCARMAGYYRDNGDFPLNGWILWYNQHAFLTGKIFNQDAYFNSNQIYPLPHTLTYSEHLFVPSLLFSPLFWITHNLVFSVNCFGLLGLVLSFITSYYTLNYFTRHKAGSILGAMVYTFNPITFLAFPEHWQLINKYFLPLIFLYGYQFFTQPRLKTAFPFFLFFTLNALSVIYYEIFSVITLPFFILPLVRVQLKHDGFEYVKKLLKYSVVAIPFLLLLYYFNSPYVDFSRKEGALRNLDVQRHFSARLVDWALPNPDSFLYGELAKQIRGERDPQKFYPSEKVLFLNFVPLTLFVIAWICLIGGKEIKNENLSSKAALVGFLLVLGVSCLFTFGPYFLGWNNDYGETRLPFYYLYELTPIVDGIRGPSRFQFMFYIPFSLGVAYGARSLFKKYQSRRGILFCIIAAIVLAENYHVRTYQERSEILPYLARTGPKTFSFLADRTTFHFPTFTPNAEAKMFYWDAMYLNWDTVTGEKMLNGYSGYFPDDWVDFLTLLKKDLNEAALKDLRAIGIEFVILHKNLLPPSVLERHAELYRKGAVFENSEIWILSLDRYDFQINRCNPEDLVMKDFKMTAVDGLPAHYEVELSNPGDCYLANTLNDRYKPIVFKVGTNVFHSTLRLPLLIRPHQDVLTSGVLRPSKTETHPLPNVRASLILSRDRVEK